ncbi:MAG: hypothetical protein M1812_005360 [Candelaria pacifica]|nr:MAG: hypothetical protein M1812_005360 [Candelaria pacifica]
MLFTSSLKLYLYLEITSYCLAVPWMPGSFETPRKNLGTTSNLGPKPVASEAAVSSIVAQPESHGEFESDQGVATHGSTIEPLEPRLPDQGTTASQRPSDCTNPLADSQPACWGELDVTRHLQEWWAKNEETCNTQPSYRGKGFAHCYRLIVGRGTFHNNACNDISTFCEAPANFSDYSPQEFYVLQSVHGIWWWYTSIWWAILDAGFLTSLNASAIVKEINPINPGDTSLGILLSALSAGFAFLAFPAGQAGTAAGKLAATAIGQAPGLGKALLPTGSLDSEFTQLAGIESALSTVVQKFQITLANLLNNTLSDFTSFISFAADGYFIASPPSLNASVGNLTKILSTFIVSQALQANNIIATVAENTYPYNLTHGLDPYRMVPQDFTLVFCSDDSQPTSDGSQPTEGPLKCMPKQYKMNPQNAWHVNCQEPPNEYGVCDNWWYDAKGGGAYALFNLGKIGENYYDLMNTMFSQQWTSGEELFLGARNCSWQIADAYQKKPLVSFDDTKLFLDPLALKVGCNSNLRFCTWNQTNNPSKRDHLEFEYHQLQGCIYAWPDMCEQLDPNLGSDDSSYTLAAGIGGPSTNITNVKDCHKLPDIDLATFGPVIDGYHYHDNSWVNPVLGISEAFGWGGVGYHRTTGTECYPWPASYLGPGLWLDTEFCEP